MTIEPATKAVLEKLASSPLPKIHTLTPPEGREQLEKTAHILDARDVPIGAADDREIPGPAGPIPVRVYTPDVPDNGAAEGPLPGLVFYHGGGFVIGSLATHDPACRILANASGCRVVSVDYRRAPEHPFPAAVEDAFAAAEWIAANAAEVGIDPARLAVGGDSAGGNLTAVVAQLARTAGAPKLAFQLLIYPTTDATKGTGSHKEFSEGYFLEAEMMAWFFNHYASGADRSDPRLSPLLGDLAGLPPALLVTAGLDPLRDEGRAYAEKLRAAGVPVNHVNHEGMIHGFINMTGAIPAARTALEEMAGELKRALG